MEIEETHCAYKYNPQIKFASPEGRNRSLEAFHLIEAGCGVWQVIEYLRYCVTKTRLVIEASPWMFTGKEIYDAKSLLMKVVRKQGAVSAILHNDLCSMFFYKDMNLEMFTPNPTTSMDDLLACHLNKERERLMADPKTFSGTHPLVQLLNQNMSSKRLCLPLKAIADIELRPTTKRLLAQNPHKPLELAQLNRLLLEDAFDQELVKAGEVGVPSSKSVIQGVPCGSAFTDPDLLKFDRAADQLEEELSSLSSWLVDKEASFSLQKRAQRLQRIRRQARELSEFATSIFTTPSALSDRITKVLRLQNKPSFSFPPSVFQVEEHEPLLLFEVPRDVFVAEPILELCRTLSGFNSWRSNISVDLETWQIIENIHALFHACYPCNYSFSPGCCPASDGDLASAERALHQCVESLRDFVTIALSDRAKVNPGSPVVVAAAKNSPAPVTQEAPGENVREVAAQRSQIPEKTPLHDPQTYTVKIVRPKSLKELPKGASRPDEIDVTVHVGPVDPKSAGQKCNPASRQALLVLYSLLGESGIGPVDKDEFLRRSYQSTSMKKMASNPVKLFNGRLGAKGDLYRGTGIRVLVASDGKKTAKVTGPKFESDLSQEKVLTHLMAHLWP